VVLTKPKKIQLFLFAFVSFGLQSFSDGRIDTYTPPSNTNQSFESNLDWPLRPCEVRQKLYITCCSILFQAYFDKKVELTKICLVPPIITEKSAPSGPLTVIIGTALAPKNLHP
jgi:hypothetical protein